MMNTTTHSGRLGAMALIGMAALVAIAPLSGCRGGREDKRPREFFPDLDNQMKWRPQGSSEFFADGRMMRRPVANTVPFGRVNFTMTEEQMGADKAWARHWMEQRQDFLKADDAFYTGKGEGGAFLTKIPVAVDRQMLELGHKKYDIYCAACHGYLGDGKGMVGKNWSYALPTFHDPKYQPGAMEDFVDEATKQTSKRAALTALDGHIFDVARNGLWDAQGNNKMPAYGHALSERDAWAVVAYIRALQVARGTSISDPSIPETQREALNRSKPAAPAPTPAPAPAAPTSGGQQ
jgi:mono/diheme cytochrome c family protein